MTVDKGEATDRNGGDATDGTVASVGESAGQGRTAAMAESNIKSARLALERGLAVFPIAISYDEKKKKTNKRPLTEHGHKDATQNPSVFEDLLQRARSKLKAGEVLAGGCVPGSVDCVVFDGDVHDGKDGPAFLEEQLASPQDTYRTRTASGGVHWWLRKRDASARVGNRSPWTSFGVDIRSDDGWVVVPGTITPWGEWGDPVKPVWGEFAEVPEAVWMELTDEGHRSTKGPGGNSWVRYQPDAHDKLLHPDALDFLTWLSSPERGSHRVDLSRVTVRWSASGEPFLYLTRPGKNSGVSATLGFVRPGALYVFSSNWPGVEPDRCYTMWELQEQSSASSGHVPRTDETDETAPRTRLWRADEMPPSESVRWLVPRLLPAGQVSVLVGDEGIGKSLWWVLLVAVLTSGRAEPLLGLPERDPQSVALVITEDGWADTVRPRLEAAGADLKYVHLIAECDDGSGAPEFPRDLSLVYEAAEAASVSFVVLDSWLDTVSASKVVKDPQQARQALHPWKEAAQRTGVSVLLIAHTNRTQSADLRDRVGATGAIRQKSRSVLFAAQPPDTPGVLYLGVDKSNNSRKSPAMEYRIDPVQVRQPADLDDGTVPVLRIVGFTAATMQQHSDNWLASHSPDASADDRLWDWFASYVSEHGEEVDDHWVVDVAVAQQRAGEARHNPQRLTPCVKAHGGTSKASGFGGSWVYLVPASGLQDGGPPVSSV